METVLMPDLEKSNGLRREARDREGPVRLLTAEGKTYYVTKKIEYTCTCPDYVYRQMECKHIRTMKGFM